MTHNNLDADAETSGFESVVAGGCAGLVARFVIAPMDVVKIRLQLHSSSTVAHTIREIFYKEGVTAFWKGNIPAETMYVLYGAVEFGTYKYLNHLCRVDLGLGNDWTVLLSGAFAGSAATVATYPLDLLRTRFAAQKSVKAYSGLYEAVQNIYRHEGMKGFTKGLGTSLVSVFPFMGSFFWIYGQTRDFMENNRQLNMLPAPEVVAGIIGGAFSKALVFPLDTLRKRLQITGPGHHIFIGDKALGHELLNNSNAFQLARQIAAREGLRGFYRGLGIALVKGAPTSAVSMWAFEKSLVLLRWNRETTHMV